MKMNTPGEKLTREAQMMGRDVTYVDMFEYEDTKGKITFLIYDTAPLIMHKEMLAERRWSVYVNDSPTAGGIMHIDLSGV